MIPVCTVACRTSFIEGRQHAAFLPCDLPHQFLTVFAVFDGGATATEICINNIVIVMMIIQRICREDCTRQDFSGKSIDVITLVSFRQQREQRLPTCLLELQGRKANLPW